MGNTYYHHAIEHHRWPFQQDVFPHDWPHAMWFTADARDLDLVYDRNRHALASWFATHRDEILQGKADPDQTGNLVRINIWSHHIRNHGIVKPLLLHYKNNQLEVAVGSSRLAAIESYRNKVAIPAFISCGITTELPTHTWYRIRTADQFADTCRAVTGDVFLFRWTCPSAEFALDWYEHDTARTRLITPDTAQCAGWLQAYLRSTGAVIDCDWFDEPIDWHLYSSMHES